MAVKTYDPNNILMIFGAISIDGGLADGTFVTVEYNEDAFTLMMGSDGNGARAKSNNNSGRATFTVLQTSEVNQLLSAQHNIDKLSPSGDGIAPLLIKDKEGATLVAAGTAWIVKSANSEYAKEVSTREWIIETDNLDMLVGGN